MKKGTVLLLLATGASLVSAAIIAVSHCVLPKPIWAYSPPVGWTIYPPLAALPGVENAYNGPDVPGMTESYVYVGALAGATVAAALAFGAWLVGLWLLRGQELPRKWMKILPVILLIPCTIHLVGMLSYYRAVQNQIQTLEGYLDKRSELELPSQLSLADSLVEHAKSQREIDSIYEALD